MIKNALENKDLPVYGKGENVRDWLHVFDHCAAIDLILFRGKSGEIYNIGGHNERKNIDVVKTILKELNKPETLIKYVADRKGHDLRYAIDPSKIERELGWRDKYYFDICINQYIKCYFNNHKWVQNIISGEFLRLMGSYYKD